MTMHSAQCPRCGGVLAVNQDGWMICHTCGYSSPPCAQRARLLGGAGSE
ncbi:hypothetical protein [Streptomyces purpureus]|nr:hypothetical protein [Streptomyces purpureus]